MTTVFCPRDGRKCPRYFSAGTRRRAIVMSIRGAATRLRQLDGAASAPVRVRTKYSRAVRAGAVRPAMVISTVCNVAGLGRQREAAWFAGFFTVGAPYGIQMRQRAATAPREATL